MNLFYYILLLNAYIIMIQKKCHQQIIAKMKMLSDEKALSHHFVGHIFFFYDLQLLLLSIR